MALFKIAEHLSHTDNLKYPHKGRVLKTDEEEPLKLGRVKCVVKGLYEDTAGDLEKIPWHYPQNPYGLGGRPDSSWFSVPELESEVTVVFPFGDIYHPYYQGYWQSDLTHQHLLFNEDYPHSYGFIDSTTEWFKVNKKGDAKADSYIEFFRKYLKDLVRIDEAGNFWIHIPNSLYVKIDEDSRIEIGGEDVKKVGKSVSQEIGEKQVVKIGTDKLVKIGNDQWTKVGNDKRLDVKNNRTIDIDNDDYLDIKANRTLTVGVDNLNDIKAKHTLKVGSDNVLDVKANSTSRIAADNLIDVGANSTEEVGGDQKIKASGKQEIDVGGDQSIKAGGFASTEASTVYHNSGITTTATVAAEAGDAGKAEEVPKLILEGKFLTKVPPEIEKLEEKIAEMETKIAELEALATSIEEEAKKKRPKIALPTNMA